MLFLESTSIKEIFNKKDGLNPKLQSFETLSEEKKEKTRTSYDKTENSVREEKKGLKEGFPLPQGHKKSPKVFLL